MIETDILRFIRGAGREFRPFFSSRLLQKIKSLDIQAYHIDLKDLQHDVSRPPEKV